jgi:hypothetical protein
VGERGVRGDEIDLRDHHAHSSRPPGDLKLARSGCHPGRRPMKAAEGSAWDYFGGPPRRLHRVDLCAAKNTSEAPWEHREGSSMGRLMRARDNRRTAEAQLTVVLFSRCRLLVPRMDQPKQTKVR